MSAGHISNSKDMWKKITGFDDYYVSDKGEVVNRNFRGTGVERGLKPFKNGKGYFQVELWREGKGRKYFVHRLVLEAFCPIEGKYEVDHIDGCRTNNRLSNLRWVTSAENKANPIRLERLRKKRAA